jgi:CheY-like chemotaxis protein
LVNVFSITSRLKEDSIDYDTSQIATDSCVDHSSEVVGRSLRILLVEDNRVNQLAAYGMLRKQNHTIVIANNGLEALSVLEKETFDLILMDIDMPELDGIQTTKIIREKQDVGKYIPIIALTASVVDSNTERLFSCGMDGYVAKPAKASNLFAEIDRVLKLKPVST